MRKSFSIDSPVLGKPKFGTEETNNFRKAIRNIGKMERNDLKLAFRHAGFNPTFTTDTAGEQYLSGPINHDVGDSQTGMKDIKNLYKTIADATKDDYGVRLADARALSKGIIIPEDVLRYSIGDFLSPTKLINNSIETQIQKRNDAVGTPPYNTAEQLRGKLVSNLYDREHFDRLNN